MIMITKIPTIIDPIKVIRYDKAHRIDRNIKMTTSPMETLIIIVLRRRA